MRSRRARPLSSRVAAGAVAGLVGEQRLAGGDGAGGRITSQVMSRAATLAVGGVVEASGSTAGSPASVGLGERSRCGHPACRCRRPGTACRCGGRARARNWASDARCIRLCAVCRCGRDSRPRGWPASGVMPYSPKIVLATSPSVTSAHSRTFSVGVHQPGGVLAPDLDVALRRPGVEMQVCAEDVAVDQAVRLAVGGLGRDRDVGHRRQARDRPGSVVVAGLSVR